MTKKKKQAEPPANERYLSHGDHVALLLADKDAAVAQLTADRDAARLDAFRARAEQRLAAMEKRAAENTAALDAASDARRRLATDMARRYAIAWEDVALEPLSGQLIAVPKD